MTAGLLLIAVAHPGMLLPNVTFESDVWAILDKPACTDNRQLPKQQTGLLEGRSDTPLTLFQQIDRSRLWCCDEGKIPFMLKQAPAANGACDSRNIVH